MGRLLALAAVMSMFLLPPLAAQTVTVTSPNGGESWPLGSSRAITWNFTNAGGATVNITLRNGGGKVGDIRTGVPLSSGSWTWQDVGRLENGTQVPNGTDYVVRINIVGLNTRDDSDAAFSLTGTGQALTLQLLSPNGGETWTAGSQQSIAWKAEGWGGSIQLNLFKDGKLVGTIDGNVASTLGSFAWTVGKLLDNKTSGFGGGFKVRAVRKYPGQNIPQNALMDESDLPFHIRIAVTDVTSSQMPSAPVLSKKLEKPFLGQIFYYGDGKPIENGTDLVTCYSMTGCPLPLKAILCDVQGKALRELDQLNPPQREAPCLDWYIHVKPDTVPVGDYRIKLQSTQDVCFAMSDVFSIKIKGQ